MYLDILIYEFSEYIVISYYVTIILSGIEIIITCGFSLFVPSHSISVFLTAILRYKLQTIKSVQFKCTMIFFLVKLEL